MGGKDARVGREYVRAPESSWASRLHIAKKPFPDANKQERFGLRICHDLVGVNKTQVRAVANYPSTIDQIEKASGHRLYIQTDAHGQFKIFLLNDASSEACTVWTPLGKIRPTRLVFGHTNAATYAQGAFRRFQDEDLDSDTREHHAYFQDDTCLFAAPANDCEAPKAKHWEELLRRWRQVLEMYRKRGATLTAKKTKVGYGTAAFYGHEVGPEGHRQNHSPGTIPIVV